MAKTASQTSRLYQAFPQNRLFDSHCHLESMPGYIKPQVEAAIAAGVSNIVTVGIDIKSSLAGLAIQKKYPEVVLAGIGLQPEIVIPGSDIYDKSITTINAGETIQQIEKCLIDNEFKLIGECGLDYYWLERNETLTASEIENCKYLQQFLLKEQLKLAQLFKLPVSLHSRAAEADCIDACKQYAHKLPVIFHSFTGNLEQAQEIISSGFKIGINAIITYKSAAALRELFIKIVGNNKIDSVKDLYELGFYLETDSPLLVPSNSKQHESFNSPKQLPYIWQFITTLLRKNEA